SYYQDMALVQYDPIAAAREYLNSADARDENEPNDPNDLIELDFGTPQHDLVDQIYNYITTPQLFARIVRNCELLPDVSLKARATDIVIHKWSKLVISGSQAYDALLNEKETPDEIQASFNALDQKQKGLLEKLMKCYGPVMSIFMLYDCIGTRFLGKTLEDVLAKHET